MRVVFNALSSYRQRTGVGSYAAHLAAELKRLAGDAVTVFPEGWLAPVAAIAGRMLAGHSVNGKGDAASHLLPASLGGQVRSAVKAGVIDLCERSFRRACRSGAFDVYKSEERRVGKEWRS